MKRAVIYLISIFLFFQGPLLAYSSNPKDFVNELVNEAIDKLSDKNLNKDQKAIFIEKVALENVDIDALGLYTLGELRKSSKSVPEIPNNSFSLMVTWANGSTKVSANKPKLSLAVEGPKIGRTK